ncbi:hypothetical protein V8D89_002907 [Ganoderma adspersum]
MTSKFNMSPYESHYYYPSQTPTTSFLPPIELESISTLWTKNMDIDALGRVTSQIVAEVQSLVGAVPLPLGSNFIGVLHSLHDAFGHGRTIISGFMNATAPIHHMPPEVLAKIFAFSAEVNVRNLRKLTQVCRYWRDLAILTPTLWTTIRLRSTRDRHPNSDYFRSNAALHNEDDGIYGQKLPSHPGATHLGRANGLRSVMQLVFWQGSLHFQFESQFDCMQSLYSFQSLLSGAEDVHLHYPSANSYANLARLLYVTLPLAFPSLKALLLARCNLQPAHGLGWRDDSQS